MPAAPEPEGGAITQTTASAPFTSPPLVRPRQAPFLGVAAGLARTTGTSPALWRVLTVVLSLFAGLGIVLYLFAAAAIPPEGVERSVLQRLWQGPDRRLRGGEVLLLVLLVLGTAGLLTSSDGFLAVVVVTGLVVLWLRTARRRRQGRLDPLTGLAPDPAAGAVPIDPAATVRRPLSPLTLPTVGLVVAVSATLVVLGLSGAVSVPAEVVLASALGVTGLGLVVGSRQGRSPWLVAMVVVLAVSLGATALGRPVVEDGVGDRTWTPTASSSYEHGMGEVTLDLRSLPAGEGAPVVVDARLRVGSMLVLLPADARVSLTAHADLGDVALPDGSQDGLDVDRYLEIGPVEGPRVTLDVEVGLGEINVRRG